jgi:hypothetical protein
MTGGENLRHEIAISGDKIAGMEQGEAVARNKHPEERIFNTKGQRVKEERFRLNSSLTL